MEGRLTFNTGVKKRLTLNHKTSPCSFQRDEYIGILTIIYFHGGRAIVCYHLKEG